MQKIWNFYKKFENFAKNLKILQKIWNFYQKFWKFCGRWDPQKCLSQILSPDKNFEKFCAPGAQKFLKNLAKIWPKFGSKINVHFRKNKNFWWNFQKNSKFWILEIFAKFLRTFFPAGKIDPNIREFGVAGGQILDDFGQILQISVRPIFADFLFFVRKFPVRKRWFFDDFFEKKSQKFSGTNFGIFLISQKFKKTQFPVTKRFFEGDYPEKFWASGRDFPLWPAWGGEGARNFQITKNRDFFRNEATKILIWFSTLCGSH